MQPQKFLNQIKNNNQVTGVVTKTSQDIYWDYYVQVLGFLNGKYFAILFKSNDGKEKIEISSVTEEIGIFKEYFNIFE